MHCCCCVLFVDFWINHFYAHGFKFPNFFLFLFLFLILPSFISFFFQFTFPSPLKLSYKIFLFPSRWRRSLRNILEKWVEMSKIYKNTSNLFSFQSRNLHSLFNQFNLLYFRWKLWHVDMGRIIQNLCSFWHWNRLWMVFAVAH